MSTLLFASYFILDKLLNFSEPRFPYLQSDNYTNFIELLWGLEGKKNVCRVPCIVFDTINTTFINDRCED